MTSNDHEFQIGDYIEIVETLGAMERYKKGDRGFITGMIKRLQFFQQIVADTVWIYSVDFDNGNTGVVYAREMCAVSEPQSTVELVGDGYIVLAPLFTFYITPCGEDAPDTWFDHSNGNFLNTERLQEVLNGYRSAGVPVL